uniref:Uncharacterized protein n=1 Tax=Glossina austeni TaxID=7395 RepID=A0A1A9UEE4_GLOAU
MEALNYSLSLILMLSLCHVCIAWPTRYIRATDDDLTAFQLDDEDLNPVNAEAKSVKNRYACLSFPNPPHRCLINKHRIVCDAPLIQSLGFQENCLRLIKEET